MNQKTNTNPFLTSENEDIVHQKKASFSKNKDGVLQELSVVITKSKRKADDEEAIQRPAKRISRFDDGHLSKSASGHKKNSRRVDCQVLKTEHEYLTKIKRYHNNMARQLEEIARQMDELCILFEEFHKEFLKRSRENDKNMKSTINEIQITGDENQKDPIAEVDFESVGNIIKAMDNLQLISHNEDPVTTGGDVESLRNIIMAVDNLRLDDDSKKTSIAEEAVKEVGNKHNKI
ncbi:hypothetical protein BGZ65_001448 [Modicella reniformis]|uniref:Uncharacterized protein n=1 Tax=Modicella reniformis TaxID=1440133 RepID=A0A9P6MIP5_9FUNG|nr:hypothetical protein BGZ65_001448 [Modicella reniformis]